MFADTRELPYSNRIKIPEIVIQIDLATKRFWYFFNRFFIFLLAIHCNRQNHQSSNKLSIGDLIVRLSSDFIKLKKLTRQKFETREKAFSEIMNRSDKMIWWGEERNNKEPRIYLFHNLIPANQKKRQARNKQQELFRQSLLGYQ